MELELQRTCLNGFELALSRTAVQEETLESIVPDACPDITRIVDAGGQAFLLSRDLTAGSLRMTGNIRVSVLYIPEGEAGPRHLDVQLPFVCMVDDPAIQSGCLAIAVPRVCSADARAVNPRKIFVRAEFAVSVQICRPCTCSAACQVSAGEKDGIQQRREEQEVTLITAVQEKPFTFSDVLSLPASRPAAQELLRSHVEPRNLDAKVIGSKLILKGEAELTALCRAADGTAFQTRFSLPYSQILELGGNHEDAQVLVEPAVTGLECTLQPGEPGALAVTLELLAQAAVWEKQSVTLLTDLYSTKGALEPERTDFSVLHLDGWEAKRESIRQFFEHPVPVGTVVDCTLSIGQVSGSREEGRWLTQASATVSVLFLGEDGALYSASYPITKTCEPADGGDGGVICRCTAGGELTAVPVTGGLEVRSELDFFFLRTRRLTCSCVEGVRELPQSGGEPERPSVVLRMVGEREELWDIAKSCASTIGDIMAANELEQASAPAGMLLLIPRSR